MCLKNNICPFKNSIYSNAAKIFLSCIINLKPSFVSRLSEKGLQIPLIVALPGFATDICFIHEQGRMSALWARNYTVNVIIFAGGKFRENVGKTFHVGVIFTIFHLFPY